MQQYTYSHKNEVDRKFKFLTLLLDNFNLEMRDSCRMFKCHKEISFEHIVMHIPPENMVIFFLSETKFFCSIWLNLPNWIFIQADPCGIIYFGQR